MVIQNFSGFFQSLAANLGFNLLRTYLIIVIIKQSQLKNKSLWYKPPSSNISIYLIFLASQDGEIIYSDWKIEIDSDSAKPVSKFKFLNTCLNLNISLTLKYLRLYSAFLRFLLICYSSLSHWWH